MVLFGGGHVAVQLVDLLGLGAGKSAVQSFAILEDFTKAFEYAV